LEKLSVGLLTAPVSIEALAVAHEAALDLAQASGLIEMSAPIEVVQMLACNRMDVRRWLTEWLSACADHGGQAPPDLSEWLPWSMSPQSRLALTRL